MSDFIRCSKCGSKVYNMQIHTTEVCEKQQQKRDLKSPWPLKSWAEDKVMWSKECANILKDTVRAYALRIYRA